MEVQGTKKVGRETPHSLHTEKLHKLLHPFMFTHCHIQAKDSFVLNNVKSIAAPCWASDSEKGKNAWVKKD